MLTPVPPLPFYMHTSPRPTITHWAQLPITSTAFFPPTLHISRVLVALVHKPKVNLVKDAIAVLGVKRVVQFYNETVEVQRAGGQCVSNGNTK